MRAMLFLACNLLSNVLALCEETQVVQHVQSFDVANMWVAEVWVSSALEFHIKPRE